VRLALFVDGCFCTLSEARDEAKEQSRVLARKLSANKQRDKIVNRTLRRRLRVFGFGNTSLRSQKAFDTSPDALTPALSIRWRGASNSPDRAERCGSALVRRIQRRCVEDSFGAWNSASGDSCNLDAQLSAISICS